MDKLIKWLENSFAPKLQKITNLTWIVVIKDSMMQLLPFILAGSIFCVGTILNDYIPALPSFWTPFGWTMSKIGLMASFLIPFNYCEKKRFRKQRILAGFTGMMLFMICVDPQSAEEMGQGHSLYGANGMFVAIFTGIIVGMVFGAFAQVAGVDVAGAVQAVFMPLQSALTSPVGFVFFCFLKCFIYSMGISTWVLTPVDEPVKLAVITANLELVAAGVATYQNLGIFTETFMFCTYLWIGGIGCTLSLCLLMMVICKSSELKALGRACIVPGIFNINEPIIFGAIAWNPLLMLPMWIQGIILPIVTYIFTKVIPFAPIPRIQFDLWYCPYPISTFIATQGSITGVIFAILTFVLSAVIWFPFVKAYDDQKVKEETAAIKA